MNDDVQDGSFLVRSSPDMGSDAELLSPGRRSAGVAAAAKLGRPGDGHGPLHWVASYRAPWMGSPDVCQQSCKRVGIHLWFQRT